MTHGVDSTGTFAALAGERPVAPIAKLAAPMAKMIKIMTPTDGAGRTRVT
jgi:hypothetical protein